MQSKEKNNKTTCTETEKPIVPLPANKVAEIVGCSESLVKKINAGIRPTDSKKSEKVAMVNDLWAHTTNPLIAEITRIVKFK